jgi:hypothetical protein
VKEISGQKFSNEVVQISRQMGFKIETNRDGLTQIDFGNKKLHVGHLEKLYPKILAPDADVAKVIEAVAPGRPCTHKPMKDIVARIKASS